MRFDLKTEYPQADFDRIETMKQIVINKFKEYELPLSKIRAGRLPGKEKGIYVYHPNGALYYQNKRELVEKLSETRFLYRRYKKSYRMNFIATENLEEFENFLKMAISEALARKSS